MKLNTGSPLLLLSFLSITQTRSIPTQNSTLALSDNAISVKFSDWLSAMNTADEATILDFYSTSFNSSSSSESANATLPSSVLLQPTQLAWMVNYTGGFELVDIEPEFEYSDTEITVLLQQKSRPGFPVFYRAKMVIDDQEPGHPITHLDLFPVSTPLKMIPMSHPNRTLYEKGLQPLTPALREKLVASIAKVLRERYIDPTKAEEKVAILEMNLESGEYDDMVDSNDFSMRISNNLVNVNDTDEFKFHQFFLSYQEPWELRQPTEEEKRSLAEDQKLQYQNLGHGFENVSFDIEVLPGKTVATLPIKNLFSIEDPGVLEAASKVMNSVADADVLILDLRYCFGMSADTAAFVLSFLFDEERPLTKLFDREGIVQKVTKTRSIEELRAEGIVQNNYFGGRKPVYVLTNNHTTKEAELIAYTVQVYGRGVVIGEQETTYGWAHPFEERFKICEEEFGPGWWTMFVQTSRMVHEATGSNWQKFGVKSDVVVEEMEEEGNVIIKLGWLLLRLRGRRGLWCKMSCVDWTMGLSSIKIFSPYELTFILGRGKEYSTIIMKRMV